MAGWDFMKIKSFICGSWPSVDMVIYIQCNEPSQSRPFHFNSDRAIALV